MLSYLNLNSISESDRNFLIEKYPNFIELNISGKERSELTERRILSILKLEKPKTSEYDFLYNNLKLELKQAEAYLKQPKFQQIKPNCYPYIICMLNYRDKSEWYLLETSKISKKAGKANVEAGKLPLNAQHRYNVNEGQINPNSAFKKVAIFLGNFEPLLYHKNDLNLSTDSVLTIFSNIENIVKNH